jgi:hypothetical protein
VYLYRSLGELRCMLPATLPELKQLQNAVDTVPQEGSNDGKR